MGLFSPVWDFKLKKFLMHRHQETSTSGATSGNASGAGVSDGISISGDGTPVLPYGVINQGVMHDQLGGLFGGTVDDHQHITTAQLEALNNAAPASALVDYLPVTAYITPLTGSFGSGDLVSGVLNVTHDRGDTSMFSSIVDNGYNVTLDDRMIHFSNNAIAVDLSQYNVTGTWKYKFI